MLMHILSPYPAHRSALPDCVKLVTSGLSGRKEKLIFGYDYDGWNMTPTIEAFETLRPRASAPGLAQRRSFVDLVHAVQLRGAVFAWEITTL